MWMEVHQPDDLRTAYAPDFLHAEQCSRGWFFVFLKPQLRTEFCVFLHRAADTDHRRACVWACGPTDRDRERARACAAPRAITPGGERDFVRVDAGVDHHHHRTLGRDVRSTALHAVEFDREFYIRGWCA